MKKKIATILILSVTAATALSGCKGTDATETEYDTESTSMFVEVEAGTQWRIMYDKETKVMYVMSDGYENRGVFTELVDENGKPKLWEGDEK